MRCPRPHFPWSGIQIPSEASHRWHIGSSQGTDSTRWGQCPVGPVDSMRTWRCLILKPGRRKKAWCSVFRPDPTKTKEQLPGNCWNSRANACSSDACVILVSSVYKMEGYKVKRKRESVGKNECESASKRQRTGQMESDKIMNRDHPMVSIIPGLQRWPTVAPVHRYTHPFLLLLSASLLLYMKQQVYTFAYA